MTCIVHTDPPSIECCECGRTSYHRMDILNRYCGFCHVFHDAPMTIRQDAVFPDNPVYVKSSQMQKLTDKQRLEQLALNDATVAACMEMYQRGAMSYELMLEGLVVLLVQQKEAAVAQLLEHSLQFMPPLVVNRDQVPLDLQPAQEPRPGHVSEFMPTIPDYLAKS